MGASETGIEGKPTLRPGGNILLIRLFALLAFLFGFPYLTQGVSKLITIPSERFSFFILLIELAIIFFDLVIGAASIFIGAGLFFLKEWARKAWLVFLSLTLLVHFHMTVILFLAGYSHFAVIFRWIGVVIFFSIISWVYLSNAPTKARFH